MTPAGSRSSALAPAPVQVAGVVNAYCAMLAERAGFAALYLYEAFERRADEHAAVTRSRPT